MANLFCTKCGGKLTEGARFCTVCGAPVPAKVPTAPEIPNAVPAYRQDAYYEPEPPYYDPAAEAYYTQRDSWTEPTYYTPPPVAVREPEPAPNAPEPAAKKAEKRLRGAVRTILAVLLCIVIFAVTIVGQALLGTQITLSEEGVHDRVEDVLSEMGRVPVSGVYPDADANDTLSDAVAEAVTAEGVAISARDVERFLESDELTDVLAGLISRYLRDIVNDTSRAVLDEEAIRELLQDNADVLEDLVNAELRESDIRYAAREFANSGVTEITDVRTLKEAAPEVYLAVKYTLSPRVLIAVGAILLVLIFLLLLSNRWCPSRTARDLGITLTVAGALLSIPFGLVLLLVRPELNGVAGAELVALLAKNLLSGFLLVTLCVLIAGVVLIVVGIILKVLLNRARAKKAA